ncbi:MAG: DUF1540 domain-containing protein [Clostridiales bacterium]|nr:DUF1540 domain-containing protein [Clostridiales bacterium]
MSKGGMQTIGCEVTSCQYNSQGSECSLNSIQVRPSMHNQSEQQNESLCGSYSHKSGESW